MANVIETIWGCIVEFGSDGTKSMAMVCLDPGSIKPAEYHRITTEVFEHAFGSGFVVMLNRAEELNLENATVTIHPGVAYDIRNPDQKDPLCFLVTATPPYDPSDEYPSTPGVE